MNFYTFSDTCLLTPVGFCLTLHCILVTCEHSCSLNYLRIYVWLLKLFLYFSPEYRTKQILQEYLESVSFKIGRNFYEISSLILFNKET